MKGGKYTDRKVYTVPITLSMNKIVWVLME